MRFQTEKHVLKDNKSESTGGDAFNEIFLKLKKTMNQEKTKKLGFRYFCKFITCALTLRQQNMYIYVFRALLGFCNFPASFCEFLKASSKLTQFQIKFYVSRVRFLTSKCTSMLLHSKSVQRNLAFFLDSKRKSMFHRLTKVMLLSKTL